MICWRVEEGGRPIVEERRAACERGLRCAAVALRELGTEEYDVDVCVGQEERELAEERHELELLLAAEQVHRDRRPPHQVRQLADREVQRERILHQERRHARRGQAAPPIVLGPRGEELRTERRRRARLGERVQPRQLRGRL